MYMNRNIEELIAERKKIGEKMKDLQAKNISLLGELCKLRNEETYYIAKLANVELEISFLQNNTVTKQGIYTQQAGAMPEDNDFLASRSMINDGEKFAVDSQNTYEPTKGQQREKLVLEPRNTAAQEDILDDILGGPQGATEEEQGDLLLEGKQYANFMDVFATRFRTMQKLAIASDVAEFLSMATYDHWKSDIKLRESVFLQRTDSTGSYYAEEVPFKGEVYYLVGLRQTIPVEKRTITVYAIDKFFEFDEKKALAGVSLTLARPAVFKLRGDGLFELVEQGLLKVR